MKPFSDYRFVCLSLALLAMLFLFMHPQEQKERPVYHFTFIVDITRSMNAEDYRSGGQAVSRLNHVKQSLQALLVKLPCQSKVGLGLFTERRSTLLFEPIEVCSGFSEIDAAISNIDWRMAWAADSRIAAGLLNTEEMLLKMNSDSSLVFMTDGQEAPPVNPRYRSDFSAVQNKLKGVLVGVGGFKPVPIPKFNGKGEAIGFYGVDDVPHRSSFGESNLNPEDIKGYNARNAPFGSEAASGNEHLASLHENYLQQLASEAGLNYHRLSSADALSRALQIDEFAIKKQTMVDVRWQSAGVAFFFISLIYMRIEKKH